MKQTLAIALLAVAPFAAFAHHGPDVSTAELLGASPVAVAFSTPFSAPALSQANPATTSKTAMAGG
ncbi:MAG: hypothetical protein ACRBB0_09275 [Pelagimonas sp.]|uniref:hypothetical protein n=1 Tax=Pelagimonas sp. TaxID=2073170 RepID=UPI003D6AD1BB